MLMRNQAQGAARIVRAGAMLVAAGVCLPAAADIAHNMNPVWAPDVFGGYSSSTVSVRFAPGQVPGDGVANHPALDALLAKWGAVKVERAYNMPFGNPELAAKVGVDRNYIITVPEGTDTPTMVAELQGIPGVFDSVTVVGIGGTAQTIPNDPQFSGCYGLHNTGQSTCAGTGKSDADVDAPEAWDIFTGEDNVVVAVIDSGVNINHEDLLGHTVAGWNTVQNNEYLVDDCPHGTHCAGTVAAIGDNGKGVVGVSWNALIMPVKVLTGCGGNTTDCAEGIIWAADNGAHVETMSLQYYTFDQFHLDSVQYADGLGVIVIAAAGNGPQNVVAYPAKYQNCMAIAATTNQDTWAGFSNYGPEIDMCAPGQDVLSSVASGGYQCYSGTSMATPHVAGAAALIRSYNPAFTPDEVEEILKTTVDDLGDPGWDQRLGEGRLNVYNAILISTPGVYMKVANPPTGLHAPGEVLSFDVTIKQGNDELVPNSQLLHYRYDGGEYQTSALVYKEGETWTATLPETACGDKPEFYVSAEGVNTGVVVFPKDAPEKVLEFSVGELETSYIAVTGFNNGLPEGWTADGFWHVGELCSVGDSCDGGTYAYFGKDANCRYNNGQTKAIGTLKTLIDLPNIAAVGKLEISYCWTLQTENKPGLDTAKVYVNGVQVHQATESPNSWTTGTADITAYEGQTVELSFVFDSKDQYYNNFRGWQVDGLQFAITDVVCRGDECYADYNGDGTLDLFDFLAFTNDFNAGEGKANCDNEGGFDLFDFLCFTNAFNAGC
jgi:subtilisin family serine protease